MLKIKVGAGNKLLVGAGGARRAGSRTGGCWMGGRRGAAMGDKRRGLKEEAVAAEACQAVVSALCTHCQPTPHIHLRACPQTHRTPPVSSRPAAHRPAPSPPTAASKWTDSRYDHTPKMDGHDTCRAASTRLHSLAHSVCGLRIHVTHTCPLCAYLTRKHLPCMPSFICHLSYHYTPLGLVWFSMDWYFVFTTHPPALPLASSHSMLSLLPFPPLLCTPPPRRPSAPSCPCCLAGRRHVVAGRCGGPVTAGRGGDRVRAHRRAGAAAG